MVGIKTQRTEDLVRKASLGLGEWWFPWCSSPFHSKAPRAPEEGQGLLQPSQEEIYFAQGYAPIGICSSGGVGKGLALRLDSG